MFFPILFFSLGNNNYGNFSYTQGDELELNAGENETTVFLFSSEISGFVKKSGEKSEFKGTSLAVSNSDSVIFSNNVTGFFWRINTSICRGKVYEFHGEQLLYLRAAFPKPASENDHSCFFFNENSIKGKMSTSLFGHNSRIIVYSSDENSTLVESKSGTNALLNNIQIAKPFFISIGSLPKESVFDVDIKLDEKSRNSKCYSMPISSFDGATNTSSEFSLDQTTLICTNDENKNIGTSIIATICAIAFIIIVIIVLMCFCSKDSEGGENEYMPDV